MTAVAMVEIMNITVVDIEGTVVVKMGVVVIVVLKTMVVAETVKVMVVERVGCGSEDGVEAVMEVMTVLKLMVVVYEW